jgi:hypothetical protein
MDVTSRISGFELGALDVIALRDADLGTETNRVFQVDRVADGALTLLLNTLLMVHHREDAE